MNRSCLLLALIVACSLPASILAQTTLAKWTFETSQPGVVTLPASPGAGNWLTNVTAEVGSGTAAGWHVGAATYSSPAGNGSSHSFSANTWSNVPAGDFFQFSVSTTGFQNIVVSWDQVGSATGPKNFHLAYSTDGVNFTQFGSTYNVLSSPSWSASSSTTLESYTNDLSSITSINNSSVVYFRLINDSNTSINGATVQSGGTDRIDNFTVSGASLVSAPQILTDIHSTNAYKGDTIVFNVLVSGASPLSYQWYYPNLSTPLTDGSSGYPNGTITGSTSNTLTLAYIDPAQAGNYQVIITNAAGSITSSIANLTIGVRTPITNTIAYLRMLQDPVNWVPTDVTNLYCTTGIVTSPFNFTSGNNTEFFIQDATGKGIAVFAANGTSLPSPGDQVQVTGPLGQFRGLLELNLDFNNPTHSIVTLSSGNSAPTPAFLDFSNLTNIPYLETNVEGSIVIVSNVFLQRSNPQFISATSVNMTNVNGKILPLFVNAAANDVIAQNIPVFASSVVGHFGQFTTTTPATNGYELDIMQYADLVDGNSTPPQPFMKIQQAGTNSIVTWNDVFFVVQTATNVAGPYTDLVGARTPLTVPSTNSPSFYRVHYP